MGLWNCETIFLEGLRFRHPRRAQYFLFKDVTLITFLILVPLGGGSGVRVERGGLRAKRGFTLNCLSLCLFDSLRRSGGVQCMVWGLGWVYLEPCKWLAEACSLLMVIASPQKNSTNSLGAGGEWVAEWAPPRFPCGCVL